MANTLSLFAQHAPKKPLAEEVRPEALTEIHGQEHLFAEDAILMQMIKASNLSNLILWGPPGCGKTTLAKIILKLFRSSHHGESFSAITNNSADFKQLFADAIKRREAGMGTIVMVDEIHRLNRAQQDLFLPHMENGTIVLIGATTENPSFELNAALLSRSGLLVFKALDDVALNSLLERAERKQNLSLPLDPDARSLLVQLAGGDGRFLLNACDNLFNYGLNNPGKIIDSLQLASYLQRRAPIYDKSGEQHFNLISALHKSIRGSNCDAALYWLARMLQCGEDPKYILRRLLRLAYEDVGLADPQAPQVVDAAWLAFEKLGSPEGELAIAQAVVYLANAPKSNAIYRAFKQVSEFARDSASLPPPSNILNAPTKMMKDLGYGEGYIYDHDLPNAYSGQNYFPCELKGRAPSFYKPTDRGYEAKVKQFMSGLLAGKAPQD